MTTPTGELTGFAKLAYKPFGTVFGILGGLLAGKVFGIIWKKISNEPETPAPLSEDYSHARGADRRDDPGRDLRPDHHRREPVRHQGLPEVPQLQGLSRHGRMLSERTRRRVSPTYPTPRSLVSRAQARERSFGSTSSANWVRNRSWSWPGPWNTRWFSPAST